ncbi:hypothetical protein [Saccharothrix hoggarensis]|uniref:Uncharacterized protein n=1 Tax=Saccharothrix hoggarensis TaxID=913853 RepID=A0ABW3QNC6_9PSEU
MNGILLRVISAFEAAAENAQWLALALTVGLIVHYFERVSKGIVRLSREHRIRVAQKKAMDVTASAEERKIAERVLKILLSEGRALEEGDDSGDDSGDKRDGQDRAAESGES